MFWLGDELISESSDGLGSGVLYCNGEAGFLYLEIPERGVQGAVGCSCLSPGVIAGLMQRRGGKITIGLWPC